VFLSCAAAEEDLQRRRVFVVGGNSGSAVADFCRGRRRQGFCGGGGFLGSVVAAPPWTMLRKSRLIGAKHFVNFFLRYVSYDIYYHVLLASSYSMN
jgi:hypothetical protein